MIKSSVFARDHPLYTQYFEVDEDVSCLVFKDDEDNNYIVFGMQKADRSEPEYKEYMKSVAMIEKTFNITLTDKVYNLKKGSEFVPTNIQYSLDSFKVLMMGHTPFEYAMKI